MLLAPCGALDFWNRASKVLVSLVRADRSSKNRFNALIKIYKRLTPELQFLRRRFFFRLFMLSPRLCFTFLWVDSAIMRKLSCSSLLSRGLWIALQVILLLSVLLLLVGGAPKMSQELPRHLYPCWAIFDHDSWSGTSILHFWIYYNFWAFTRFDSIILHFKIMESLITTAWLYMPRFWIRSFLAYAGSKSRW